MARAGRQQIVDDAGYHFFEGQICKTNEHEQPQLIMLNKELKDSIYIDHIVLTVVNLEETKIFYTKILSPKPLEQNFL